jgi:predicted phage baseplate assembly protein
MPLRAPNLDDRRYADIVAEARSLIPRYAPEWTDHNETDPGITLVQLFAWMVEMLLFRLNRVPERLYIKFLQLMGVEQKPAAPAQAELTFVLAPSAPSSVLVPRGTRVGAEAKVPAPSAFGPVELALPPAEPVVFETEEPLFALAAVLDEVQVFDGVNYRVYTDQNQPGTAAYPAFGRTPREDNALLLGFASDEDFPADELNLYVRVPPDPEGVTEYQCDFPEEFVRVPAQLAWEYWNGFTWRPLSVLKDETRALTRSGHVYFRGPKDARKRTVGVGTGDPAGSPRYWLRCRLARSQYERPPQLEAVLTNTVRATAVATVRDEVAGASNGQPHQVFRLGHAPLHARPPRPAEERLREADARRPAPTEAEQGERDDALRRREMERMFLLEIDEGAGPRPWQEVEDFFTSGPEDRHYVLTRSTGEIRFGDGKAGRIPLAGIDNVIARYYRYGGGTGGNVGAGSITDVQTAVDSLDEVTNHWPAENGADEEPVEDTKARAPKELKARDRAVTPQDFEFLARQTPGVRVRRAHALPLHHPRYADVEVPGAITVVVVPESDEARPVPSEATLQTVCAYLDRRRLLTTEVFVAPPRYKQVTIEADVVARLAAEPAQVKTLVENRLRAYLHPLHGGPDGQGWPLGGDVVYSEVFRQILAVEGVQAVEDLRIVVEGERAGRCESVPIPKDFLVYSEGHEINVGFRAAP